MPASGTIQEEEAGGVEGMDAGGEMVIDEVAVPLAQRADPPQWVQDLVRKHEGSELQFMMEKTLEASEFSGQQCRLLIPTSHALTHIRPALSPHEMEAANLLHVGEKTQTPPCGSGEQEATTSSAIQKKRGRRHAGLDVAVYTRGGWRFRLTLIKWDSKSTVLKGGNEWMLARLWGGLRVKDRIQMWGFRDGRSNELCFVICKS